MSILQGFILITERLLKVIQSQCPWEGENVEEGTSKHPTGRSLRVWT